MRELISLAPIRPYIAIARSSPISKPTNRKFLRPKLTQRSAFLAILGFGATVAFGLTALSSSAPFFERIASNVTGRKIRIVVLDRVGQGIVDAAARKAAIAAGQEAAAVAAERAGAMVVGRVLLFMASWEIQVAVIAIQVVIWALSNDDLQNAMLDSVFGMERKHKVVADLKRQDEAFDKALVAVGFKSEETDEKGKAGQNG